MVTLSENDKKVLLLLAKDFSTLYNANSLSKIVGITRVGAQKILKNLLQEDILISKKIGKAIFYKVNYDKKLNEKLITYLLAEEAEGYKRWQEEFKELEKSCLLIHGSAVTNYKTAKDIDLLIMDRQTGKEKGIIKEKEKVLPKKIHLIIASPKEVISNITHENPAIFEILKKGIVLFRQEKYVEVLTYVTSF